MKDNQTIRRFKMSRNSNAEILETRMTDKTYLENGKLIHRVVKETVSSRDINLMLLPVEQFKKNYIFCDRYFFLVELNSNYLLYYSMNMMGDEIKKKLCDSKGTLKDKAKIAVVTYNFELCL